jgi:hypothetical protein
LFGPCMFILLAWKPVRPRLSLLNLKTG